MQVKIFIPGIIFLIRLQNGDEINTILSNKKNHLEAQDNKLWCASATPANITNCR